MKVNQNAVYLKTYMLYANYISIELEEFKKRKERESLKNGDIKFILEMQFNPSIS